MGAPEGPQAPGWLETPRRSRGAPRYASPQDRSRQRSRRSNAVGALPDRDAAADLAGDPVPRRDLLEHLLVLGARGHAERAARVEAAPGRRVDGARHIALEQDPLSLHGGIGYGDRRKSASVYGCFGFV